MLTGNTRTEQENKNYFTKEEVKQAIKKSFWGTASVGRLVDETKLLKELNLF